MYRTKDTTHDPHRCGRQRQSDPLKVVGGRVGTQALATSLAAPNTPIGCGLVPLVEARRIARPGAVIGVADADEGRWWSLLRDASDPAAVVPGAVVIAGTDRSWSVVRIEQVDDDGQVHFVAVPPDDPAAARLLARSA